MLGVAAILLSGCKDASKEPSQAPATEEKSQAEIDREADSILKAAEVSRTQIAQQEKEAEQASLDSVLDEVRRLGRGQGKAMGKLQSSPNMSWNVVSSALPEKFQDDKTVYKAFCEAYAEGRRQAK